MKIAVFPLYKDFIKPAESLSKRLGLPLIEDKEGVDSYGAVLTVGEKGLALQQCGEKTPGAVYVDFVGGAVGHRRKFGGGKGQMIAKAVGLQSLKNPYVIDATAGLGRDGFVLASLGCRVEMLERSGLVFELLQDGLARARDDKEVADIASRISIINVDAAEYLRGIKEKADVIYLDPMFPMREKTALVKKEMQLFHEIIGKDEDGAALLEAALEKAIFRVVVKRPRKAPVLSGVMPYFNIEGKSSRFDVYVNKGIKKA